MSNNFRFRGCFDRQYNKRAKALFKSASQHLYHIHQSLPRKLSWKKSLLVTCKILGLLLKILAADEKYPVLNRDNLTIPIQMQLSQRQITFFAFFAKFFQFRLNFDHSEKKDDPCRFCFSEITDSENMVR